MERVDLNVLKVFLQRNTLENWQKSTNRRVFYFGLACAKISDRYNWVQMVFYDQKLYLTQFMDLIMEKSSRLVTLDLVLRPLVELKRNGIRTVAIY